MRTMPTLLVAFALLLTACGADSGSSSSELREVDARAISANVFYYAPEASAVPLTAAELASAGVARADAVPIRIELLDGFAVGWFAPEGAAIIRRETIVALWNVVDRTPIVGEARPGEEPSVVDVAPDSGTTVVSAPGLRAGIEQPPSRTAPAQTATQAERALIDFVNRLGSPEEFWMIEALAESHPGCI